MESWPLEVKKKHIIIFISVMCKGIWTDNVTRLQNGGGGNRNLKYINYAR